MYLHFARLVGFTIFGRHERSDGAEGCCREEEENRRKDKGVINDKENKEWKYRKQNKKKKCKGIIDIWSVRAMAEAILPNLS